jgi:hypothetical protein
MERDGVSLRVDFEGVEDGRFGLSWRASRRGSPSFTGRRRRTLSDRSSSTSSMEMRSAPSALHLSGDKDEQSRRGKAVCLGQSVCCERSGNLVELFDRQPDVERGVVFFEPTRSYTREYQLYVSASNGVGRAGKG